MNLAVQPLLRDWGAQRRAARAVEDGRLLDQFRIDWFRELNRALTDRLHDDAFAARAADNVQRMQWLARKSSRARDAHPASTAMASMRCPIDAGRGFAVAGVVRRRGLRLCFFHPFSESPLGGRTVQIAHNAQGRFTANPGAPLRLRRIKSVSLRERDVEM